MADKAFYAITSEEALKRVQTTVADGLSPDQAAQRLAQNGPNALAQGKKKTLAERFLDQFKDFMIMVLLAAALIAGFVVHEWADAGIILAVVILNAIFGVFQESKAEEAIDALAKMATPNAHVRRGGQILTIPSSELVVGDIVLLEAGDVVPADLRLVESANLQIEESALTGESVPVDKQVEPLTGADIGIGDRTNMAFMNSNITYGRGVGVVVATGMQTEVGRIAGMLNAAHETTTPLQDNLKALGKTLTIMILVIAVIVFGVGVWRGAESVPEMFLTAISLAVAAIPEGLPAIVTIILALGTQKMAKRNALVRKLPAVETLGSTDIIASDKTGTLTQNKMTVEKVYYDGALHDASAGITSANPIMTIMNFANDTQVQDDGKLLGDPTETALVAYGKTQGFDLDAALAKEPRVAEVPFDSERKLMTTIHQLADGSYLVATKGAPDQLLKRVTQLATGDEVAPLTEADQKQILSANKGMATQALRVLGMAYKHLDVLPETIDTNTIEQDLIFAGLVGMIDPERPEAAKAVAEAKAAGIRPMMITGDHQDTAEAIAARLGIIEPGDDAAVITGAELDKQSDAEFEKNVTKYSVYARVAPEHKVRIVNAWQKRGKVVAMTGDGVNDAPALKAADIGIGMGITGTEVSKGASDMVLADDNFSTIVIAVEEGRKVFSNIQKSIQYLLSANLGEVLTLFMMTMLGWDLLAPVHILWINLVTDTFPAIALGVEPTEPGIMKQKPRGRASNFFTGGVGPAVIWQGLLEGALTLGVYFIAITWPVHSSYAAIHADALTMAYATLGLIQLFHAFNVKSVHQSLFTVGAFRNKAFNWAILVSGLLLAVTILVPGFNGLFHVTTLDLFQWAIVLGAGVAIIVIVEIVKFVLRATKKR
ncbi:MAG: cation-translocating P-type ATPase [Lactobacillus sp.]|uniref:Cation-translocating P-type ATPase n=1 Tax=Lacticaseibacillus suilingensis TaxID=2799577 RepID=A0ABW4BHD9_9LACO|nr:cation-translocating P-type ATPase [Lacticaseibacillus suilingensis]MCI1893885.1 cation-translocating P-type ATPase [Lactobacillus sp.]MCI1917415.1 cation-translocating P-type ATPase [Lactobacillus sp.]MCI1941955.1 cation-translocating P-type ATPase [Lactobacillus sp.]MCI1972906.1 cation-translocating P-type ATPase [Lactobacillus sp.]MCI2016679.1 cation-translocating P-type ATPase [Lactobacillus sp.]